MSETSKEYTLDKLPQISKKMLLSRRSHGKWCKNVKRMRKIGKKETGLQAIYNKIIDVEAFPIFYNFITLLYPTLNTTSQLQQSQCLKRNQFHANVREKRVSEFQ